MKPQRTDDLHIAIRAAEWQEALKDGGPRERAAFVDWLLESRRHVRNYLLLSAFERELRQFDPQRLHDVDALLAESPANIVALQTEAGHKRPRLRRWGLGIAAAVGCVLLSWLVVYATLDSHVHTTRTGEQQTVKLDDGSIVYLNAQSEIDIDYTRQVRAIRLVKGEALFVVEKDATRPFNVMVDNTVVQAVGTQFNVYRRQADTRVSVIEGRVRVLRDIENKKELLAAGEEVRIASGRVVEKHSVPNVESRVAWRQRRLEFREDPLAVVVAEFNRYNRAPQFRVADGAIGARHYTGVFNADDPESLAKLLSQEDDLVLQRSDQEIVIQRR